MTSKSGLSLSFQRWLRPGVSSGTRDWRHRPVNSSKTDVISDCGVQTVPRRSSLHATFVLHVLLDEQTSAYLLNKGNNINAPQVAFSETHTIASAFLNSKVHYKCHKTRGTEFMKGCRLKYRIVHYTTSTHFLRKPLSYKLTPYDSQIFQAAPKVSGMLKRMWLTSQ